MSDSPDEIIVNFSKSWRYILKTPVVDRGDGVCTGIEPNGSEPSAGRGTKVATSATRTDPAFDVVADDAGVGRADDAGVGRANDAGVDTDISSHAHADTGKGKSAAATGQLADLEVQAVYSPDADIFDHFGYSVSLSADGNTLAVGTPFDLERKPIAAALADPERGGHSASGTVSVYERVGGQWAEKARLRPSAGYFDDEFGHSVSLSADGSTLAVGAPGTDRGTCQNEERDFVHPRDRYTGVAYIFERSAAGRWVQHACLDDNDDGKETAGFGKQVTLSADGQLLVTASHNHRQRNNVVHIFERNSSNWLRGSAPKPPPNPPDEKWSFGYAKSFAINNDGSVIAISAQDRNNVFVYTRDEPHALGDSDEPHTRGWQLSATLEPPSSEIGRVAQLGISVSLNGAGDRLVATAAEKIHLYRQADRGSKDCPKNCVKIDTSEALPYYGLMAVYEMAADGDWGLQTQLRVTPLIPGYIDLRWNSYKSAMSFDGDIIIVGGFGEDFLGRAFASIADDGIPTIPTEVRNNPSYTSRPYGTMMTYPAHMRNMQPGELWGYETATWDRAYHRPKRAFESAWLAVHKDGVWQQPGRIRPPGTNQHDRFGQSVAIDAIGQTIAIGAPKRSAPITDNRPAPLKYGDGILQSGAAFIYIRPDTDE